MIWINSFPSRLGRGLRFQSVSEATKNESRIGTGRGIGTLGDPPMRPPEQYCFSVLNIGILGKIFKIHH